MSTPHPTHVRTTLTVDRETADVLRVEAKKVAMFEHELFEDFVDFSPRAQFGLSLRYRDVFDLIDAVGWNSKKADRDKRRFEVPLTDDLIDMLGLRREDLALTINDRFGEYDDGPVPSEILDEITTDRLAIGALDRLFQKYACAIRD